MTAVDALPTSSAAPAELVAVRLYQLTELQSGANLLAFRAAGLSAVQALLCGPEGASAAAAYGWHPPYPATGHLRRRRMWADAVAGRTVVAAFAALDAEDRADWLHLLHHLPGARARL